MSCYWSIKCLDCNEEAGLDGNHAVEFMRAVIQHAVPLAALRGLDVEITSLYGGLSQAWFATHAEHKLIPVNEYGELDGDCAESFACPACGCTHFCTLPKGHDANAAHSFRRA